MVTYKEMLTMEHPTSKKHPRMDAMNRAAQFMPFAALTGHDEAIEATARDNEERMEIAGNLYREMMDFGS